MARRFIAGWSRLMMPGSVGTAVIIFQPSLRDRISTFTFPALKRGAIINLSLRDTRFMVNEERYSRPVT